MKRYIACAAAALMLAGGAAFAQMPQSKGSADIPSGTPQRPLELLSRPEVQRDMQLDERQKAEIQRLEETIRQETLQASQMQARRLTPAQQRQVSAALVADRDAADREARRILDRKQTARLRQLELQKEGVRAITRDDVSAELKLSFNQRRDIQNALMAEQVTMEQAGQARNPRFRVSPGQRSAALNAAGTVHAAVDAKLNSILTDAQKDQFREMEGEPLGRAGRGPASTTQQAPPPNSGTPPSPGLFHPRPTRFVPR